MCVRYQPGEKTIILDHFIAEMQSPFNAGPETVHPKEPGWVVRLKDGVFIMEQMTWGFPVVLKGKQGQPLKPKPVSRPSTNEQPFRLILRFSQRNLNACMRR